jgi:hypothetical protein
MSNDQQEEAKTIRVRVESGDQKFSMKITNAETGEAIDHVSSMWFQCDAGDPFATGSLVLIDPVVDAVVDADVHHICPQCGHTTDKAQDPVAFDDEMTWLRTIVKEELGTLGDVITKTLLQEHKDLVRDELAKLLSTSFKHFQGVPREA